MSPRHRLYRIVAHASALLIAVYSLGFSAEAPKPAKEEEEEFITLSPFMVSSGGLGATPGGAQDINFFRMGAGAGAIPHPDTITAEGLFSEHDLPLDLGDTSENLFRVQSAAAHARFEVLPRIRYLAQLGLSSGLRADSWQRAPLNLVAVVDKSGSMSGEPLALVRASLLSALDHLRDGDQLAIVLYGDVSHVHLPPTPVHRTTRHEIAKQIKAIESAGSTNMEEGLQVGYDVARKSAVGFAGTTRVMLFTDERPNVGNTEAEGFMAMAEAASRDGIGLTTIGVGVQFGAELATRISSVRGGNLFFFPDGTEMKTTFADDFDPMVTELAHQFSVRIAPARGFRIEGVFGLPADILRWDGDAIVMDVATIFLSKRKGAIYFALGQDTDNPNLPTRIPQLGETLASVSFSYENAVTALTQRGSTACRLISPDVAQAGLTRGKHLVDEYVTLKKAAQTHAFENNQEGAFRLASGLLSRLSAAGDVALEPEIKLVRNLHNTLALLSGHAGEMQSGDPKKPVSPLVGVWRSTSGNHESDEIFLVVWANGILEQLTVYREERVVSERETFTLDGPIPTRARGTLPIARHDRESFTTSKYELSGDTLKLGESGFGDDRTMLTFARCSYSDIPFETPAAKSAAVDELSGLPGEETVILTPCYFGTGSAETN